MYILGNNAAGISNKLESFKRNLDKFKPGVYFIQETKSRRKNQVKLNDDSVFEHIRKDKGGGGLLTAVHKNLKPVSVSEENHIEILVVQGEINNNKVRFINGYGPQESQKEETRVEFFDRLDLEVKSAMIAGTAICIELDANSKLGNVIIPGDPEEKSRNGKLLEKVVEENDLIVVNGTNLFKVKITRYVLLIKSDEQI